jgi:hypothetical protein
MTPVQKQPPAAPGPAISLPEQNSAAKAPAKPEPSGEKAARAPEAKPEPVKKEAAPANKAENAAKPQEKTAARPKRPVHHGPSETERVTREDERYRQYYGAPPGQPYQRGYEETWRESEGPAYRPPYYAPPRYEREETEVWRVEPYPYRYAPPSYYREAPAPYGFYRGAPPPPPWAW